MIKKYSAQHWKKSGVNIAPIDSSAKVGGSFSSGGNLTLQSTSHATKGKILFGTSAYDEVNNRLGIGTTNPQNRLDLGLGPSTPGNARLSSYSYWGLIYSSSSSVIGYNAKANEDAVSNVLVANTNATVGYNFIKIGYPEGIAFHTKDGSVTAGDVASSERMRINQAGNVGINATTIGAKLQVNSGAAGDVVSIFRAVGSQTGDLTQWQRSDGFALSKVLASGAFDVTPASLTTTSGLLTALAFSAIYSAPINGTGTVNGVAGNALLNAIGTGAASTPLAIGGAYAGIANSVTAGFNMPNAKVVGTRARAYCNPSMAGTVGSLSGIEVDFWGYSGSVAGNITTLKALQISSPTLSSGAGLITNAYGIFIDNITGASTNNYAIYSNGGISYFKDSVGINTTSPDKTLQVVGDVKIGDDNTNYALFTTGRLSYVGTARKAWTKYTAQSVTVTAGTSTSVVGDLQTMQDGSFYTLTEAAATPGMDLIVDFTNVKAFENVRILGAYDGFATHAVACQVYNWATAAWNTFDSIQSQAFDITTANGNILCNQEFHVYDDTNYIGTGGDAGKVRVRFYHTMAGNASHKLYLDEVSLRQ